MLGHDAGQTVHQKRGAALASLVAACGLTALKLVVGLMTGSLGMLSDAAHSGLDLLGAALTLVSVRISDKPADADHPYGHARVETLSAFTETFLMGASCVWIVVEAMMRIFVRPTEVKPSPWPFAVIALAVVVDFTRSRHLRRVASASGSQALEADALHFASDIWSSLAVALGLVAAYAGQRLHVGWLRYADPVAALAVSGIILRFAWGLARRTTFELLDTAPEGASERMARAAEAVAGVLAVERVRVRRAGSRTFAELRVAVPRFDTAEHIEGIVERVGAAVRSVAPDADVTIRAVPRQAPGESVFDHIRGVAARSNVTLHDLIIQQQAGGGLRVEQHIELPESLPLVEAHRFVRELEDRMYRAAPDVTSILTHIESTPSTIESAPPPEPDCGLEEELRRIASELPEVLDIHEVAVSRVGDHLRLSCHCTLPDTMPMSRVHEVITELEDRLKLERPEVDRMLVHPEPQADNRHEHRHRTPATISETTEHTHERERRVAERAAVHGPVRERPYADL